jgi:hypothetical protein
MARNKAVADGAVSFYLDRLVVARVSSFDYGADCCIPFHANDPEHLARANAARPGLPAPEYLGGSFDVILPKVRWLQLSLCNTHCRCRAFA